MYQTQIFTDSNNYTMQAKVNEWLINHPNIHIAFTNLSSQSDGWHTLIIFYNTINEEISNA